MEPRRLLPVLLTIVAVSALWIWSQWSDGAGVPDSTDSSAGRTAEAASATGHPAAAEAGDSPLAEVARTTVEKDVDLAGGADGVRFDGLVGRFQCPGERFNWPVELTWYPKYGGAGGNRTVARTEADGSFRMDGEVYAGGSVHFPAEYEIVRVEGAIDPTISKRDVRFAGLTGPLVLHAELRDGWIGRVLHEGSPAANVRVDCHWSLRSESEEQSDGSSVRSSADGVFRIPSPHFESPALLRMVFMDSSAGFRGEVEIEAQDFPSDADLGDFHLALGRDVTLVIQDPHGHPVAGARVESPGHGFLARQRRTPQVLVGAVPEGEADLLGRGAELSGAQQSAGDVEGG